MLTDELIQQIRELLDQHFGTVQQGQQEQCEGHHGQ